MGSFILYTHLLTMPRVRAGPFTIFRVIGSFGKATCTCQPQRQSVWQEEKRAAIMDIVERMAASQPAQLGWKPESAVEWGQRICNGISSHIAEVGQKYECLKSQLR